MNKKIRFLLIIIISSVTQYLQAQPIDAITPDNAAQVTDQIFDLYGDLIDQDYAMIHEFLEDLVPESSLDPGYDASCEAPTPEYANYFLDEISFDWDPSSNPTAYGYNVSFIKLNGVSTPGGEYGNLTTTANNISFNASNGLLIVVFQTVCSATLDIVGSGKVIIVEKPILAGNTIGGECECIEDSPIYEYSFEGTPEGGDQINAPYIHQENEGYYTGNFFFYGGQLVQSAKFALKITNNQNEPIIVGHVGGCMINIEVSESGTYMYLVSEIFNSSVLGILTFSDGFTFNPSNGVSGNFALSLCGDRSGGTGNTSGTGKGKRSHAISNSQGDSWRNFDRGLITSYPNPAKNTISFTLPFSKVDDYNYSIIDVLGNPVSFKNIGLPKREGSLELDIENLSPGTYYLLAQNGQKVMKTRFVKMN